LIPVILLALLTGCSSATSRPSVPATRPSSPPPASTGNLPGTGPWDSSAPAAATPAPGVADFDCSIDRPGIGGLYTLTITNPGTTVIYVNGVQINFYDGQGNLIDTATTSVDEYVNPGQSVVTHDAEEVSASPPAPVVRPAGRGRRREADCRLGVDPLLANELHGSRLGSFTRVRSFSWSYEVDAGRWRCCTSLLYRRPHFSAVPSSAYDRTVMCPACAPDRWTERLCRLTALDLAVDGPCSPGCHGR
jgi:hypothetical protein